MSAKFLLSWDNVSYEIIQKKQGFFRTTSEKKNIIKNVSGAAKSNSLIAIMGPSGSGKTTLLGAISGRLRGATGNIKINGTETTSKIMKNISGYIQQDDVFTDALTVYEHMQFMSALKLNVKKSEREKIFNKLLSELSLQACSNTTIRSLSGGEKRRLALATELLDNPPILFCDEPTTGLDSFSAIVVLQKLQDQAMKGKIVLTTIHQPSSQLLNYFHNIILIANGCLIFQGPQMEALEFFESAKLYCPESYNPADFYMKCLTINTDEGHSGTKRVKMLQKMYEVKQQTQKNLSEENTYSLNGILKQKKNRRPLFFQIKWLLWRDVIDARGSIREIFHNYMYLLVTSLIIAISYSFVTLHDRDSVQNIEGVLSLCISEIVFTHMYAVIYTFPKDLAIFVKEKNLYSSWCYFLTKFIMIMPKCLFNSLSYLVVFYSVLNFLHGAQLFVQIIYVLFCTSLASSAFGLSMSALFTKPEYIDLFIVPIEFLCMTLSGIWIKINSVPLVFSWIKYLSPFYHGLESFSILQWKDIDVLENCANQTIYPCYSNGKDVLRQYGFQEDYYGVVFNIVFLYFLATFYCIVGFLGIYRKRIIFNSY